MTQPEDNPKELISEYSISDAAEKLTIPENTLRKYLNYFNLKVEKNKRKSFLSEETLRYLAEILQLKSNGLSLKQIKSLCEKQFNQQDLLTLNSLPEEVKEEIKPEINTNQDENIIIAQNIENNIPELEEVFINVNESFIPEFDINTSQVLENNYNHDQLNNNLENQEENLENPEYNENEDQRHYNQSNVHSEEDDDNNWSSSHSQGQTILTKDYVNKEIAVQGKRVSRLYRFLNSRNLSRDSVEIKADLDRRVIFLNGLRYFRDNWLERKDYQNQDYQNHSSRNGNRREQRGFSGV